MQLMVNDVEVELKNLSQTYFVFTLGIKSLKES